MEELENSEKEETLISFAKVFHIGDDIECLSEIDFSMCLNGTFKAFVCFTLVSWLRSAIKEVNNWDIAQLAK